MGHLTAWCLGRLRLFMGVGREVKKLKCDWVSESISDNLVPENDLECDSRWLLWDLLLRKAKHRKKKKHFSTRGKGSFLCFRSHLIPFLNKLQCEREIHQIEMYVVQRPYSTCAREVEPNYYGELQRRKLLNDAKTKLKRQQQRLRLCCYCYHYYYWATLTGFFCL